MHAHSRATTRVDRTEKHTHTALKSSTYRCHTALPSLHTHLPTIPTTRSFPDSQRGKSSDWHRPFPWLPIYSHHSRAVSYPSSALRTISQRTSHSFQNCWAHSWSRTTAKSYIDAVMFALIASPKATWANETQLDQSTAGSNSCATTSLALFLYKIIIPA